MKKAYGFTIVELLIVIVVIGILATISIVAYNGVSNNANDATVKNDLANFAKKIQLLHAETGAYPPGSRVQTSPTVGSGGYFDIPGVTFQFSKGSYFLPTGTGDVNLGYCTGVETASGRPGYHVVARGRSGNVFSYSSARGLEEWTPRAIGETISCTGIGYPRSYNYGYSSSAGWQAWTN